MARLKLRGDTYYSDFIINGKRVVKTTGIKVGDNPKESRKRAQTQADLHERLAKGEITVDAAIEATRAIAVSYGLACNIPTIAEYLNNYTAGGGEQNQRNYRRAVKVFIGWLGEKALRRLDALTVQDCRNFLKAQLVEVAFGTVGRYKSTLSPAFTEAVAADLIPKNPFSYCNMGKLAPADMKRKTERQAFTVEEFKLIMASFASPWRELVALSYYTGGQRIGDCCCMKWENVDFTANTISFSTAKTGRRIIVPIVDALRVLIEPLRGNGSEYLFPDLQHAYTRSSGSVSIKVTSMLEAIGIKCYDEHQNLKGRRRRVSRKSFHSIRHTTTSLLRSDASFSPDIVRTIVGHDSEEIERGYFHADKERIRQGIEHLAQKIAPTEETP